MMEELVKELETWKEGWNELWNDKKIFRFLQPHELQKPTYVTQGKQQLARWLVGLDKHLEENAIKTLIYYTMHYGVGYFLPSKITFAETVVRCAFKVIERNVHTYILEPSSHGFAIFESKIDAINQHKCEGQHFYTLVHCFNNFVYIVPICYADVLKIRDRYLNPFSIEKAKPKEERLKFHFERTLHAALRMGDSGSFRVYPFDITSELFNRKLNNMGLKLLQDIRNCLEENRNCERALQLFFDTRTLLKTSELVLKPRFTTNVPGYGAIRCVAQAKNYVIFDAKWKDPFTNKAKKKRYILILQNEDFVLLPFRKLKPSEINSSEDVLATMLKALNASTIEFEGFCFIKFSKTNFSPASLFYECNQLRLNENLVLRGDLHVAGDWVEVRNAAVAYDPKDPRKALALEEGTYIIL